MKFIFFSCKKKLINNNKPCLKTHAAKYTRIALYLLALWILAECLQAWHVLSWGVFCWASQNPPPRTALKTSIWIQRKGTQSCATFLESRWFKKKKKKLKKQVLQSFHQKMLKMFPHKFTAFSMWAGCWLRVCATFLKCWQSPCACVICVVLVSTFCSSLCFLNSSCCSSSSTHRHLGQVLV